MFCVSNQKLAVGEAWQTPCFLATRTRTQSHVQVAAPIWKKVDWAISRVQADPQVSSIQRQHIAGGNMLATAAKAEPALPKDVATLARRS